MEIEKWNKLTQPQKIQKWEKLTQVQKLRIKLNNPEFSFKKVTNKKEVTLKLTRKQASEIHYWLEFGSDSLNPSDYYEDKSENQSNAIRKKRVHSILKMLDKYSIDNQETLEIG
tara:strand:+ start:2657 stop:2998 length:342 start_codon:yes stop_codon:yes gene_type:complete